MIYSLLKVGAEVPSVIKLQYIYIYIYTYTLFLSSGLLAFAHQASLSMGFSWQEYWSGFPFPSPGGLPDPGIKPGFPALNTDVFYHLSHQGNHFYVGCINIYKYYIFLLD